MLSAVVLEPQAAQDEFKARLYDFFERELREGHIALGAQQGAFDVERKKVDTVVIHHTSQPPGLSATRLSAIELVRLYGPYFVSPTSKQDKTLSGQPLYSGHVRKGVQVFWPYHWIIRNDGYARRLLRDGEIGWHAGDWEVNCRSVAIVLDNDYEHSSPGENELRAIAKVITRFYPQVLPNGIVGHREVNDRTTCPSEHFLKPNGRGWKLELLKFLRYGKLN